MLNGISNGIGIGSVVVHGENVGTSCPTYTWNEYKLEEIL
jgi:hypothetical protein